MTNATTTIARPDRPQQTNPRNAHHPFKTEAAILQNADRYVSEWALGQRDAQNDIARASNPDRLIAQRSVNTLAQHAAEFAHFTYLLDSAKRVAYVRDSLSEHHSDAATINLDAWCLIAFESATAVLNHGTGHTNVEIAAARMLLTNCIPTITGLSALMAAEYGERLDEWLARSRA